MQIDFNDMVWQRKLNRMIKLGHSNISTGLLIFKNRDRPLLKLDEVKA